MKTERQVSTDYVRRQVMSGRPRDISFSRLVGETHPVRETYRPDTLSLSADVTPTVSRESLDHHHVPSSQYAAFRAMSQLVKDEVEYKPETVGSFPLPVYSAPKPLKLVRKKLNWRRVAFRSLAFTLALFLMGGGFLFWRGYHEAGKVLAGTNTVAVLGSATVQPNLLKGEGDGRVNILLLGIGGEGHPGSDLTDTMVVASVDPINKTAALISVPRDMWIKMPVAYFGQYQKINAAYSSGKYQYLGRVDASNSDKQAINAGFDSADTAVSQVLGLRIDYNVLINFQGFKKAIDTVGGVTVDVQQPLVDPTMAWENGNNPVLASPGVQQMDGKEALLYSRSRHTSSDFARSQRQRQILMALKDKVLASGTVSNPLKINSLTQTFGDNVYTDLSTEAAMRLLMITKDISDKNTTSLDLVTGDHALVTTDHVGDISVVRPKAGFDSYSGIQKYIAQNTKDGFLVHENAGVAVASPSEASANQELTVLQGLGYTTTGAITTPARTTPQAVLVDLSNGDAPYTKHYLENHYGAAQPRSALPAGVVVPKATQFVILLGT